jgi:hypothetical protein
VLGSGEKATRICSNGIGRWLCLRVVAVCFSAGFVALRDQMVGLVGRDGIWPARFPGLEHLDGAIHAEIIIGLAASTLAVANVLPRVAFAVVVPTWGLCLFQLGPFDVYQPDSMLMSAGALCILMAPSGLAPKKRTATTRLGLDIVSVKILIACVYYGSAVAKLRSAQWIALRAMDRYFEAAPVPGKLGWLAQNNMNPRVASVLCAVVMASELAIPVLMFGGRVSRRTFVIANVTLQGAIAATASYSFLNLLMMGLGMVNLDDVSVKDDQSHSDVAPWIRSGLFVVYDTISIVALVIRILPPSVAPGLTGIARQGPAHLVNSYGLYGEIGQTGYRIDVQGKGKTGEWRTYAPECLPGTEWDAPRLIWPYQCRLDWNLWRVGKRGGFEVAPWMDRLLVQLSRGSKSVVSLFGSDPFAGDVPEETRLVLTKFQMSSIDEWRVSGRWWWIRQLPYVNPVTHTPGQQ